MKILNTAVGIMATVMVLNNVLHGFERPKLKLGFQTMRASTFVKSNGLTEWIDSDFYRFEMNTEFNFEPVILFETNLSVRYGKVQFRYNHIQDDFFIVQIGSPISSEGFKTLDNSTVYDLKSDISSHEISLGYDFENNIKSILIFSRRKNLISSDGNYTLINIAGPLFTKSITNLFGIGAEYGFDFKNDKLSIETEYIFYPKFNVDYSYSAQANLKYRKLVGTGYRWNALLILHLDSLDISGGYEYFSMQENSKLWDTKTSGVRFGINFPIYVHL